MDRRFFVVLSVVILAIAGLFIFTRDKAEVSQEVSNHVQGNASATVELINYGDFECSVCKTFYFIEKQVFEKYSDQIRVVFRHFPLDGIHANARAASRAAEAAGLQGKFFEMHDLLYENQESWVGTSQPLVLFKNYAESLGMDAQKFETDFSSEAVNATINADSNEGKRLGIDGTPTFYLDGEKLNNSEISTVESFSAKIEAAIKAKQ